ncbi:MAG: HAD-IIIA family hydrolase [Deltaproteobacteria bacterium]|nr:MAG: HAD-IIIA family hydrolase [Deltaproteobacteria bacterium]
MIGVNTHNCSKEFENFLEESFGDFNPQGSGVLTFTEQDEVNFSLRSILGSVKNAKNCIHFYYLEDEGVEGHQFDKNFKINDRGVCRENWSYSGISFTPERAEPTSPAVGAHGIPIVRYKKPNPAQLFHRALFLDRDGIVNKDKSYVHKFEDIEWVSGIFELIKAAKESKWKVVVLTNQSGVARGYYQESDVIEVHKQMNEYLEAKGCGVDGWYYSLCHNQGLIEELKAQSYYRKPWPGMMLQAASELNLEIEGALMVGDKKTDILHLPGPEYHLLQGNYDLQGADAPIHDDLCKIIPYLKS